MGDPLRDRRSVLELAQNRQVFEIASKIGDFERLAGVIEAELSVLDASERPEDWRDKPVKGQLRFGLTGAQNGAPTVHGELSAQAIARCQRCLRAFELSLETKLALRMTWPGDKWEEGQGLKGFELWELSDDSLRPIEIADEALVMALPLSARHDDNEPCVDVAKGNAREEMTTPFASLRAQMDKNN